MKRNHIDGRLFVPELVARLRPEQSTLEILAPAVGIFVGAPPEGSLVSPQSLLGELAPMDEHVAEALGVMATARAGVMGIREAAGGGRVDVGLAAAKGAVG